MMTEPIELDIMATSITKLVKLSHNYCSEIRKALDGELGHDHDANDLAATLSLIEIDIESIEIYVWASTLPPT
jgi:hypothetical protein